MPFPIGGPLKPISNGFRDIQRRMWRNGRHDLDTMIRPLNKGQGHSFWYQSDFSYMTSFAVNSDSTLALGRTVWRLATVHSVQTDRRTKHCNISAAAVSTVG